MKQISLAFACPLEAGNAVYRARSVLRTWGNYVFDDTANCDSGKEDDDKNDDGRKNKTQDNETTTPDSQWHIYPNPAQSRLWIASKQMETLENVQLFNSVGNSILSQFNKESDRMEIQLPSGLPAGLYFLRLQLENGESQIRKILLQP